MLGVLSGLSSFGMAILVPNLALLGRELDAGPSLLQFLLSGYVLGLTIAQPLWGVLSDRFGRRPVMLAGTAVFVVASFACVFATSLTTLILGRFIQAIGMSVGTVASRAVIRDICNTEQTARALSIIAAALGIAPVIAPILGGYMGADLGWQSIFVLTAALGLLSLAWIFLALPETVPVTTASEPARKSRDAMLILLGSRIFLGYTLLYGCVSSAFMTFLAVGAAVFENELGLDQRFFGTTWGLMALCYVAGAAASNRVTRMAGLWPTMRWSVAAFAVGGLSMPLAILIAGASLVTVLGPLGVLMVVSGLMTPLTLAGAVSVRPDLAGTGSGLSSSLGLLTTVLFGLVSGLTYTGHVLSTALLIGVTTVGASLGLVLAKDPHNPLEARS